MTPTDLAVKAAIEDFEKGTTMNTNEQSERDALIAMLAASPGANDGLVGYEYRVTQAQVDACRMARAALYNKQEACTTSQQPAAWALQFPGDGRLCLSTVFDTEKEASEYAEQCPSKPVIVPLLASSPAQPQQGFEALTNWTPGPNVFKDWCSQWFGPDSDDEYLGRAARELLSLAAQPQQGDNGLVVPEEVAHAARLFVAAGYRGPLHMARAVFDWVHQLAAQPPAPPAQPEAVPQGWKLMPVEPTAEMVEAAYLCTGVAPHRLIRAAKAMIAAAPPSPQPPAAQAVGDDSVKKAIREAYGWLWHVNNEPMAPVPMWSPEQAAYEARKCLRETLTAEERGEAINAVQRLLQNKVNGIGTAKPAQPEGSA